MFARVTKTLFAVALTTPLVLFNIGCEQDKKLLDVETPGGEIEIEQDKDTGAIEVEAEDK